MLAARHDDDDEDKLYAFFLKKDKRITEEPDFASVVDLVVSKLGIVPNVKDEFQGYKAEQQKNWSSFNSDRKTEALCLLRRNYLFVCFVGFYGISTFIGDLTPNPFLCK